MVAFLRLSVISSLPLIHIPTHLLTLSPSLDRSHRGRIPELLLWSFGIYRFGHLLRSDDASNMEVLMGYTRFYGPISPNFLACRLFSRVLSTRIITLPLDCVAATVLPRNGYRPCRLERTSFSHLIVGSMMALYRRVCF